MTRSAGWVGLAAPAALLVVLSGCGLFAEGHRDYGFKVANLTSGDITVEVEGMDPPLRTAIRANYIGSVTVEKDKCYGTGAVATDAGGKEIGRLDKPICDWQTWTFAADGTVSFRDDRRK